MGDNNESSVAERESHADSDISKTENDPISIRSMESPASNERARRTPNPDPNLEDISKTEKLGVIAYDHGSSGENDKKKRSKTISTGESRIRGRKLDRPCTLSAEEGKTECQLNSKDNMVPNTAAYESPMGSEIESQLVVSLPILKVLYDKLWKPRNRFVKSLIIIWFCVSTFTALRILVGLTNAYFVMSFDDCHSANRLCQEFGIACFSGCGMSRWDVYWRKT